MTAKLPVTVLSGFLGAGKTTLLNHILNQPHGLKIAVIVNDMSELNIDAKLVKSGQVGIARTEEKLVEMSNGCICCTLREDLLLEVKRLAQEGRFDYLVIESTGISEPLPVAETFTFADDDGVSLSDFTRLDTMVTVVDAFNFRRQFQEAALLAEAGQALNEDDERNLADLLTDQIEFANVIVVNKADLVSAEELNTVQGLVRTLNPDAIIIPATQSHVDLKQILNTQLFEFEKASQAPGWLKTMRGEEKSEKDEYGFSSFVFHANRPFHTARFAAFFESQSDSVVRSKGFVWLATRSDFVTQWGQAGGSIRMEPAGVWLALTPKEDWVLSPDERRDVDAKWDAIWGDRSQELVLIGQNMNNDEIRQALNACLLTDAEMKLGESLWAALPDPLPAWLPAIVDESELDCSEDSVEQRKNKIFELVERDPQAAAMEAFQLALTFRESGRVHSALPLFRTAIAALADYPEERFLMCEAQHLYITSLLESNDTARARITLNTAVQVARDAHLVAWESTFLNISGRLELSTGLNLTAARTQLERALKIREQELGLGGSESNEIRAALAEINTIEKERKAARPS